MLAEKQWDKHQIAAFFGVSHDTIHRRFASVIEEARHSGKAKLIDILWKRILEGKSDRLLEHALDRFVGPVQRKMSLELKDLSEEDFRAEVLRRLSGSRDQGTT